MFGNVPTACARGCGDGPDRAMAAKAELTDRLLLALAGQVFAPDSADYATARRLFSLPEPAPEPGPEPGLDSDNADKDNTE